MEPDTTADDRKTANNEHLYHLHRWVYFNGMLAEQCDGWLSAEEGDENLLRSKSFTERNLTCVSF